jgi:hypothetical protein
MLELINQLDGFDPRGNIKVVCLNLFHTCLLLIPKVYMHIPSNAFPSRLWQPIGTSHRRFEHFGSLSNISPFFYQSRYARSSASSTWTIRPTG